MGSFTRSAGLAVVTALIAVVITYFIADAISGPLIVTPVGGDVPEEVPVGGAVFGTVVGGIVGAVLAYISSRLGPSVQIFTGLCVVGLVLYGIIAFNAAETTTTGVWLNIMHLAAAIPIVGGLTRWLAADNS